VDLAALVRYGQRHALADPRAVNAADLHERIDLSARRDPGRDRGCASADVTAARLIPDR
jgi:hypothetical protein